MNRRRAIQSLAGFLAASPLARAQHSIPYTPERLPGLDDLVNVFEFEPVCKARISRPAYDYIALGVDNEWTLKRNRDAFDQIELRPRMLVNTLQMDLSITLFGDTVRSPILIAPTAGHQGAHPEGELATAKAAAARNTIYCVSSNSSYPLEKIAATNNAPKWWQLYPQDDMDDTRERVLRAADAGYKLICLTTDLPYASHRERQLRNRITGVYPPSAARPRRRTEETPHPYGLQVAGVGRLDWSFLDQLRNWSKLPVLVKGILTAEDTELCLKYGVQGVVVSNHGARALDYAPATIEVLPEIVQAAAGKIPVFVDSGFRRGTDIIKALAIGASAVMIGRPVLWGLGGYGQAGVERVLLMLEKELALAMGLCGKGKLKELDRSLLRYIK